MSKRDRRRQRRESGNPPAHDPVPSSDNSGEGAWFQDPRVWIVSVAAVAVVLFAVYKFWPDPDADDTPSQFAKNGLPHDLGEGIPDTDPGEFHGHKAEKKPPEKSQSDNSFLDDFNKEEPDAGNESGGGAHANRELEKQFQTLVEINDQLNNLKKRAFSSKEELTQAEEERDRLLDQFNRKSAALEKEVGKAKLARPNDPVPRWLTGELLIIVGGEPDEIEPHLQFAAAHGLKGPRLSGSLALTQLQANQFTDACRTAADALDQKGHDRYLWDAFTRASIGNNQFEPVIERLTRTFPTGLPGWAQAYRRQAEALQVKWDIEQKIRRAEAIANDLPRVRLVIEHRRFAKDLSGKPLTTIESTGRAEIVLELFENEAPLTVANFIDLVTRKFYDGTSFHLALPATMVAGGDPNTKNDDPSDDGVGGPGYFIADEYQAAAARNHFRGSISMVKTKPHTAGSQFFFSLAPLPEMNGNFTVFGRIIQGQDVADKITRGRTTRALDHFGRIIPGDLLVRAEILRKRPHEYRAVKKQP